MNELYKQEVLELTYLLRNDEDWADLREIFVKKGIKLNEIALVSFMEDGEENEYGVIIRKDKKISEYSRSTENDVNCFKIIDITNLKEKINNYPQIGVAFDMLDNGELLLE